MNAAIQQWSDNLFHALNTSNQRVLINCCGTKEWCESFALQLVSGKKYVVLSDQSDNPVAIPFKKSIQLLGQECDAVIMDAFSGFNADAFTRLAGLVKAPGIFILIHPDNSQWLKQKDIHNIWQDNKSGHSYFLKYIQQQLEQAFIITCQQHLALPSITRFPNSKKTELNSQTLLSEQQQQLWSKLQDLMTDTQLQAIAIVASRGRGKSTLLGHWLQQEEWKTKKLIITSDSKKAVEHLLVHVNQNENLRFVAIDALLKNKQLADCVVVDEAATLPVALLNQLKVTYKKIIFSTTIDGYEGTGSGFYLKLLKRYKSNNLIEFNLTKPMRWGQSDLLETWLNNTMLLNGDNQQKLDTAKPVSYRAIPQETLVSDKLLLTQILGCLKKAHYRTQVSDVMMLMNDPDSSIIVAQQDKNIVGVVVAGLEGGLDTALCEEIYYGRRRPQGHLLAQNLTAHAGSKHFAHLKGLRIRRIAVDELVQRKGIGSFLIKQVVELAKQTQLDYVGSMFAIDSERLTFWQSNKLELMYISNGVGTSTGLPSVTMLQGLSTRAKQIAVELKSEIHKDFSSRLLMQYKALEPQSVIALIQLLNAYESKPLDQCDAYINGHLGFEHVLPKLREALFFLFQRVDTKLSKQQQNLLVQVILQYQSWDERLLTQYQLSGKKELNKTIKKILIAI